MGEGAKGKRDRNAKGMKDDKRAGNEMRTRLDKRTGCGIEEWDGEADGNRGGERKLEPGGRGRW